MVFPFRLKFSRQDEQDTDDPEDGDTNRRERECRPQAEGVYQVKTGGVGGNSACVPQQNDRRKGDVVFLAEYTHVFPDQREIKRPRPDPGQHLCTAGGRKGRRTGEPEFPRCKYETSCDQHSAAAETIQKQAGKRLHGGIRIHESRTEVCDSGGRAVVELLQPVKDGSRNSDTLDVGEKVQDCSAQQQRNKPYSQGGVKRTHFSVRTTLPVFFCSARTL